MVVRLLCLTFALVFSRSASQNMTATSTTCISAETEVTLSCHTTDFNGTILFYLNGINKGGCVSTTCLTGISGYATPTQSGEFTNMIISAYNHSRDGGSWTCTYGASTSSPYTLELGNCNALCEGIRFAIVVGVLLLVCPHPVQVIIVIIIIIYETQKVTIKMKVDKKKKLKAAEQTINSGDNQQISIIENSECAIVVQGEDLHRCVVITDAGALQMEFKIKDDLLNVKHDQAIILPTILSVDPYYSTIQWTHDGVEFDNYSLYFNTIVKQATYGVYDIKMTFQNLGLTIWIEKMRVQVRRVWIVIIFCVSFNLPVGGIGGFILVLYRTTDGFCSKENVIIPIVVVFVIVYNLLHVALVYFFMTHFRGKGKNSGFCDNVLCYADVSPCSQEQANDATRTSQTGEVSPPVVPTASTTVVVSSSDVAATTSDDQDRRNWRPLPLPENYTVKKMPLTINEGNDRNLKETAEQINLLDKRL